MTQRSYAQFMVNKGRLACLVVLAALLVIGIIRGSVQYVILWLALMLVMTAFYRLNQWLVTRKRLDHRPYYVPSHWGPIGTLIIVLAHPAGWKRFP